MKEKKIIALGFFDGVHLGHQALLKACAELAAELNIMPAAITFHRHPQSLFSTAVPPLVNSLEDRHRLLAQYAMEQVITIVGANETEPAKLKISSDSPIGAALLGAKVGDVVNVDVPMGVMKLNVLEISR